MIMRVANITKNQADEILNRPESHFFDFKSKRIQPAKLSKTLSALGNAEEGDIYIGIEDPKAVGVRWDGFSNQEDANDTIAVLEATFPEGEKFSYRFIRCEAYPGIVLGCEVLKINIFRKTRKAMFILEKGRRV